MNIYVGNLPFEITEDSLQVTFTEYGEVATARVITDRMTGRSRGFGFVEMPDNDQAEAAIKALNGKDFDGRTLTVNEARPREDDGGSRGGGGGNSGGSRW
jgi:RNA recognition motif-containing protein